MTPHDPRILTVEEFRRRELHAERGFLLAIMLFALGTLIAGVIQVIAGSRLETLESFGLGVIIAVRSAHLRSRTVQQR